MNAISKLVNNWFGDDERALATSIATLSMPIGCIIGLAMSPLFIFNSDREDKDAGKSHCMYFQLFSAIMITVETVWLLIFFRERPPQYPTKLSMISDITRNTTKFSFKNDF